MCKYVIIFSPEMCWFGTSPIWTNTRVSILEQNLFIIHLKLVFICVQLIQFAKIYYQIMATAQNFWVVLGKSGVDAFHD